MEPDKLQSMGVAELDTTEQLTHTHSHTHTHTHTHTHKEDILAPKGGFVIEKNAKIEY